MKKKAIPDVFRLTKLISQFENWGFKVDHGFSRLSHPKAPNVNFDFSATDDAHLVSEAIRQAYEAGKRHGANELRQKFTALMLPQALDDNS